MIFRFGSSDSSEIDDLQLKSALTDRILRNISDIQIFNGFSLLIGAITQHVSLSLYHYYVVHITVTFSGVSATAALAAIWKKKDTNAIRVASIFAFLSFHLAFVVLFGLKLQSWDDNVLGRCYRPQVTPLQFATHPLADRVYLGTTASFSFVSFAFTFRATTRVADMTSHIVIFALILYLIYVYMLVTIRQSNEAYLSGNSENEWEFGQVVALVLVTSVLLESFRTIVEYVLIRWERQHKEASGYEKAFWPFFRAHMLDE
ncbi:hypothetical protein F4680DRAFT_410861 [Xylaria scruposa]|nr:hypothetical protein F4680DRAFT_410861 [Xylaria scruposa]